MFCICFSGLPARQQEQPRKTIRHTRFAINAITEDGQAPQFLSPVTLTIGYSDSELTAIGTSDSNLNVARYDGYRWITCYLAQTVP